MVRFQGFFLVVLYLKTFLLCVVSSSSSSCYCNSQILEKSQFPVLVVCNSMDAVIKSCTFSFIFIWVLLPFSQLLNC